MEVVCIDSTVDHLLDRLFNAHPDILLPLCDYGAKREQPWIVPFDVERRITGVCLIEPQQRRSNAVRPIFEAAER